MKKYLIYAMLSLTVFSACKKDYGVATEDKPETKVAATLAGYSATLTGATNGWKAFLYPYGGGVYLYSMKFGTNNRVTMLSDLNLASSTTPAESSYKLKQQQSASLLFDTYNYLHLLADPDPTVNGGVAGAGFYSDFEFYIDNVKGDTINLIGNRLGSKLVLVKAGSAAEYTSFTTGTVDVLGKLAQLRTYFKRITIGGIECEVRIDAANKILTFSYLDGTGNLVSVAGKFYVDGSTSTIVFITPVKIGSTTVTTMKTITYDAANHIFGATINGTAVQLKEAIAPIKIDATSPQRWHTQMNNNPNTTWISSAAFHYGVDDYCNFKNVSAYSSFWYAGPAVWGSTTAEGIISLVNGSLASPYAQNTFSTPSAGIGRLTLVGSSSGFVTTTALGSAMTAARSLMYKGTTAGSFEDWYFIQTNAGGTTYDMVRVSDAQVWISWKTL